MNGESSRQPDGDKRPAPADDVASQLIDEHLSADRVAALSGEERRRLADLQWLDALLEHAHDRDAERVSRSVSAALRRIRSEDGPTPAAVEVRRRTRRWIVSVVAASLVAAIGLLLWPNAPASAAVLIEKAFQAALQATDREYRVTVEGGLAAREATLHVRGGERFLLSMRGPLGGDLFIGCDGDEFWFAPAVGPTFAADSESFVGPWLERATLDVPHLQITTLLTRLRDRYELSVLADETLADGGPALHHLHARRRDAAVESARLPEVVELWADRRTGVVRRLVLIRSIEGAEFGPRSIRFDLVGEQTLPDSHYRLSARTANRPVVRLPEAAPKRLP